ncbi:MAG: hypothetical protein IMF06_02270 [Proteobacteria bacterium]|nr:hypothetical protein [Pseudomonadota bacterium]
MAEHIFNDRRTKPERRHGRRAAGWHLCRRKVTDRRQEKDQGYSAQWWLHTDYTVSDGSPSH